MLSRKSLKIIQEAVSRIDTGNVQTELQKDTVNIPRTSTNVFRVSLYPAKTLALNTTTSLVHDHGEEGDLPVFKELKQ